MVRCCTGDRLVEIVKVEGARTVPLGVLLSVDCKREDFLNVMDSTVVLRLQVRVSSDESIMKLEYFKVDGYLIGSYR